MASSLITSLLSLATNLLPSIRASAQAPSSSSLSSNNPQMGRACAAEKDLEKLMRTLKQIKATLYDAEEREIRDLSVKLWLKELKKVAYDAENVLSEYRYEVTRLKVEARKSYEACSSHKGKKMKSIGYIVPIPEDMVDRLNNIRCRFDDITKDREALQLRECDRVRSPNNKILRHPTGYMLNEASIFGRGAEITKIINFLIKKKKKEKSFSVISIVGKGGIGKTTIAQLIYKDGRVYECFDLVGWVCVTKEFDVTRLTIETIESVFEIYKGVNELHLSQERLAQIVKNKTILLILDDMWNENQSLWELFCVPFKEAKVVKILVTTRNNMVAKVMQTTMFFRPSNLSESSCWQLFQHYAFSGTSDNVPTHLADMGREIMRKCAGLPLAIKLIASLLRHETYEECWREILESDLWESNPSNDIFPALQISYAHLPTHLKPCFLFCSMYPENYLLEKMHLVELWISNGYIESKGKQRITEIGVEYYEELKERSFLGDFSSGQRDECCKLHDVIHDLGRHNSEKEHYSVDIDLPLKNNEVKFLREAYHLYVGDFMKYVNEIEQKNLKSLRTLCMDIKRCSGDLEHNYCINNTERTYLNKFQALRVLELKGNCFRTIPETISDLKHLVHLGITSSFLTMLPLSIGLLYNLRALILCCYTLENLPEDIGDLANLQFLYIESNKIRNLPKSLCSLSNLETLFIRSRRYLLFVPYGFVILPKIKTMIARLNVRTIAWLKNKKDLEGKLSIEGLQEMNDLANVHHANLRNKSKLEALDLCWDHGQDYDDRQVRKPYLRLRLKPETCEGRLVGENDVDSALLECLQPHPNLKKLLLRCYPSATLPEWMGDPFSLQSIQEVMLERCNKIEYLPFSNLHTLKHLFIKSCSSIRVLHLEQLSSQLKELQISRCDQLELITGLGDLNSLAALEIASCEALESLTMDEYELYSVETTEPFGNSSHHKPHIGRPKISSLTKIIFENCNSLSVLPISNFHTLKHLKIDHLSHRIRVLQLELLPAQLEELHISWCKLESITGLGNLIMLAVLHISCCWNLKSLMIDELQLVEKPHIGRQSIPSLKKLEISYCYLLHDLPDGFIYPRPSCYVRVYSCGCPSFERNKDQQ